MLFAPGDSGILAVSESGGDPVEYVALDEGDVDGASEALHTALASEGLSQSDVEAYEACKRTYISLYSHRESALVQQLNRMGDSDDPTLLIRQLDLARKYLTDLRGDLPGNQCSSYGPGQ